MTKLTAIALLKAHGSGVMPEDIGLESILDRLIADKGYNRRVVMRLGREEIFGALADHLLMRNQAIEELRYVLDYLATRAPHLRQTDSRLPHYGAHGRENIAIDQILGAERSSDPANFVGQGAAAHVNMSGVSLPRIYRTTPIAIIGFGAAGIMARRGLQDLGFENITVFEQAPPNGIWAKPAVHEGSRNNPRPVDFEEAATLDPAPGGGDEVVSFLDVVRERFEPERRQVTQVIPGDLEHVIVLKDGTQHSFPIVINAMGTGKPVPIDDPQRMTGPTARTIVAARWQDPDLKFEDVRGKRLIFIGLGNSTAEMIRQLHTFEDEGADLDYRILTHYPRDAVENPMDTVVHRGRKLRVFRDLNKPVLTSFQGDLPDARRDYYRALFRNRIVSDVTAWDVKDRAFIANAGRRTAFEGEHDKLYVLTGYRNTKAAFASMGCGYDSVDHCTPHDYDGELVHTPGAKGADRIHRGYFGFGSVLDAPFDQNASVIPGMAFRLPDLGFGVVMRAGEYVLRQEGLKKAA